MATLLKEEVAEGQRQLVALASAAASPATADGPRALTMQELEARDPTVDITAMLQQKRCAAIRLADDAFLPFLTFFECGHPGQVTPPVLPVVDSNDKCCTLSQPSPWRLPCTGMRRPSAWR